MRKWTQESKRRHRKGERQDDGWTDRAREEEREKRNKERVRMSTQERKRRYRKR